MAVKKTTEFDGMTDRYAFDFGVCSYKENFHQVDTKQDASYFGTWANPYKFQIINYCEGDIYITQCDTKEEFKEEILSLVSWNKEAGYWKGIDPGFKQDDAKVWESLDLGDLLH